METSKPFSLFLVIWAGQLLSRTGSGISAFALGVYLFGKTGSTSAYSLLLLCAFLPSVLLAPLGGVMVDRGNRKTLMGVSDGGSSLGILFVIIMFLLHPEKEWPIYLGVAVCSLFAALHAPAFKALVTDLLKEQEYGKAAGLIQFAEASRYLIAPVISAFLLGRFSIPLALAIDMLTFLVAALTVVSIRKVAVQKQGERTEESFWKDFSEGAGYLARNKMVSRLLCITVVVTFSTGILQALFVPIVLSITNGATLGTVQSLAASGMLVGSFLIGTMWNTSEEKALFRSLFTAGLFYLLIGASSNTVTITGMAFFFFLSLPFVNTSLEVLFRKNIGSALQGRLWSLISFISQSGMLVALGIAGFLADHLFNPLLTDSGLLAGTIGKIIGTGTARGSGLLIIVAGFFLLVVSIYSAREGIGG